MTYTPFERELLKEARRTNELLEYVVMALSYKPRIPVGEGQQTIEEPGAPAPRLVTPEQILEAAGLRPMTRPPGTPPTPGERQARWAARAKEVGYPAEEAQELAERVQLNLDTLVRPEPAPRKRAAKRQAQ